MGKLTIPLQSEVAKYMKEKKGWPQTFCEHYAEKFWNHYQASGWKLSSGNSIKDWKACFNAQWQTLKFKEDIELFNKLSGKPLPGTFHKSLDQPMVEPTNDVERLDAFINDYRKRPADIEFSKFGQWYDFMKAQRLLKPMFPNEINDLREVYGDDNYKCRCAVVQKTMNGYINNNLRISDLMNLRQNLTT